MNNLFKSVDVSSNEKKRTFLLKKQNINSKSRKKKYSYQKDSKKNNIRFGYQDKEKKYKLERDYERRKRRKQSIKNRNPKHKSRKIRFNMNKNKTKEYNCYTLDYQETTRFTDNNIENGYESDTEEIQNGLQIREVPEINLDDLFR